MRRTLPPFPTYIPKNRSSVLYHRSLFLLIFWPIHVWSYLLCMGTGLYLSDMLWIIPPVYLKIIFPRKMEHFLLYNFNRSLKWIRYWYYQVSCKTTGITYFYTTVTYIYILASNNMKKYICKYPFSSFAFYVATEHYIEDFFCKQNFC